MGNNPFRILWQRLRGARKPGRTRYGLEERLGIYLQDVSTEDSQPPALPAPPDPTYAGQQAAIQMWESLTPREQDVVAMVCLGLTNREVGAGLHISPETVKTHLHNALVKFQLQNRVQLRRTLSYWDFSDWKKYKPE